MDNNQAVIVLLHSLYGCTLFFEIDIVILFQDYGGGICISFGIVDLFGLIIANNSAVVSGGGLLVVGGTLALENVVFRDNDADYFADIDLQGGTMGALDLVISDYTNNSFGGDSISSLVCQSSCIFGQYGDCTPTIATDCFINCDSICVDCPGGTFVGSNGSTQVSDCEYCGSGQYAKSGSSACSSCPKGTFAANSIQDTGGGQVLQVISGAKLCNNCPAGYYAPAKATIVCQGCEPGYDSFEGSDNCAIANFDYYLTSLDTPVSIKTCPPYALCNGGYQLPVPADGYWVDRSIFENAGRIYRCYRDTCRRSNSSDWDARRFNTSTPEQCKAGAGVNNTSLTPLYTLFFISIPYIFSFFFPENYRRSSVWSLR